MLLSVVCTANAIYIAYRCYNRYIIQLTQSHTSYSAIVSAGNKSEEVAVAAGGCVPEEEREMHGVIYDQPDQAGTGGEQFAMNKNMS